MSSQFEHRWIEDFIALSKTRNFTRAALMRNVTQPQFSRRIRQLEEDLGVALVDRAAHPLELTEAGQIFAVQATELLNQYDAIRRACQRAAQSIAQSEE